MAVQAQPPWDPNGGNSSCAPALRRFQMDAEWWQPWPSAYLCPSAEGEADRRAENSESLTCLQLTEHLLYAFILHGPRTKGLAHDTPTLLPSTQKLGGHTRWEPWSGRGTFMAHQSVTAPSTLSRQQNTWNPRNPPNSAKSTGHFCSQASNVWTYQQGPHGDKWDINTVLINSNKTFYADG